MSVLYLPSFSEIMAVAASRGQQSDAPEKWSGLVGAWPLQEPGGVTAFDASGYRRDGVLTNTEAADRILGEKGMAVDLDGSNEYVQLPNLPGLFSANFTVALWGYPGAATVLTEFLFGQEVDGAHGFAFYTKVTSSDLTIRINGTERSGTDGTVAAQIWQHFAVTRLGNALTFFVNGAAAGTGTLATDGSGAGLARWGATSYTTSLSWQGKLTNGLLYDRALTASEIRDLYADPWAMYRQRRRVYAAAAGAAPTFQAAWTHGINTQIGMGV